MQAYVSERALCRGMVLALLVLCLTAFSASAQTGGGTLIMGSEPLGETLEPGLWSGFGTITVLDNLGEGLVRADFETGTIQPGLAESWEVSDDGLTYTFTLREGAVFHDDTPVNADAVVRTLQRYANTEDPAYVEGLYMQFGHGEGSFTMEALDEQTVEMVLTAPDVTMLQRLSRPSAFIISPTALDTYSADIGTNLVMAGPFKLESFTPGEEAVLVAFDDYWAGRPYLDEVIVRGYADEGAIMGALQSGEINFTTAAPLLAAPRFANSRTMRVDVGGPLITLFVGANIADEVAGNLDVRMAVNYAIDRQNLINVGLNGYGELPASMLSPTDLGFDASGRDVSQQNLERARQHLEDSGFELPLAITLSFENNRFWPQLAELVMSDLEAVGFAVTLERLDSANFWAKVNAGETQLTIQQRSTFIPDPNDKALILATTQTAGASNLQLLPAAAAMDQLIADGVAESDAEERVSIYEDIQALALEEMPYIYLAYLTPPIIVSRDVQNVPVNAAAAGRASFAQVWMGN
jgi:peptide/nickel transport system substrate-binding protein